MMLYSFIATTQAWTDLISPEITLTQFMAVLDGKLFINNVSSALTQNNTCSYQFLLLLQSSDGVGVVAVPFFKVFRS